VHRATATLALTGGLAEELRQHQLRLVPLGNGMAVPAMGVDDVLVRLKSQNRAHGDRFLAQAVVEMAADASQSALFSRDQLDTTDAEGRFALPLE